MSILNKLTGGKSAVAAAGVIKNEQKAEAPAPESRPVETGKVDSITPVVAPAQTVKASSILGTLGTRSSAKAGDSSGVASSSTTSSSGHDSVVTDQVASVAKKNLLTSTLTAVREKAEADKADHEYLFAPIPKDFQEVLNRFDDMMQRDHGILQIDLVRCRDFVKKIMIDLKENPEYDGLIIDRDVHNIIKFQRMLKSQAEEAVVTKTEKAAKRESKSKVKGGRFAVDMEAFDLNAPSQPKSIQDFSDLEL